MSATVLALAPLLLGAQEPARPAGLDPGWLGAWSDGQLSLLVEAHRIGVLDEDSGADGAPRFYRAARAGERVRLESRARLSWWTIERAGDALHVEIDGRTHRVRPLATLPRPLTVPPYPVADDPDVSPEHLEDLRV